ncbi:hypothetical protein GCM10009720_05410 [Yaniella flava]|uniref:Major facilitator superfamily (MFS) profile domain-containing protein n=1 Tax=Yaniella flava TaxID=287930 RepID=A0ABN2U4M9_9MICC|nr:hypothetical protein [Micrococcaceae bacterium]
MTPDWVRYAHRYKRKERRNAIIMGIIGALFAAVGVFLLFTGAVWIALTGMMFGLANILGGVLVWSQADGSHGSTMVAILTCLLFTVFSVLMIITSVVAPASFGHRGPVGMAIAGGLGLAFFGPGLIVLIIKYTRRRRTR